MFSSTMAPIIDRASNASVIAISVDDMSNVTFTTDMPSFNKCIVALFNLAVIIELMLLAFYTLSFILGYVSYCIKIKRVHWDFDAVKKYFITLYKSKIFGVDRVYVVTCSSHFGEPDTMICPKCRATSFKIQVFKELYDAKAFMARFRDNTYCDACCAYLHTDLRIKSVDKIC